MDKCEVHQGKGEFLMEGVTAEKGILMKMVSVANAVPIWSINRYYFNPCL